MRSIRIPVPLLLLFAPTGCAEPRPHHVAVYPVEGRLFVSGMPAANAHLTFHPVDAPGAPLPVGRTGPDGHFSLTTYAAGDGAPAGEYVVTIVWPNDAIVVDECADPTAHDRLNGAYAEPAPRRLVVTVRPESNYTDLRVAVSASAGWNVPRRTAK